MSEETPIESITPDTPADATAKDGRTSRRRRRPPITSPAELAARLRSGVMPHRASLGTLAARSDIPATVIAAVKTANGWTDDTDLTAEELRQASADWLGARANEGGKP